MPLGLELCRRLLDIIEWCVVDLSIVITPGSLNTKPYQTVIGIDSRARNEKLYKTCLLKRKERKQKKQKASRCEAIFVHEGMSKHRMVEP